MTTTQASNSNTASLDLTRTSVLIVDADKYSVEMLGQILRGFKLREQTVAEDAGAAKKCLDKSRYGLAFIEAVLPDMSGSELVQWVRRHADVAVRHMPVIMLMGHTVMQNIERARDSGASLVIRKPVVPATLFDRIVWSAKSDKPFVETDAYVGPDRRIRHLGPPGGIGRRSTDLPAEVGQASEPNLDQFEIDSLLKPVKIKID